MVRDHSDNISLVHTRVLVVFFLWNFWMFKASSNVLEEQFAVKGVSTSEMDIWMAGVYGGQGQISGEREKGKEKKDNGEA